MSRRAIAALALTLGALARAAAQSPEPPVELTDVSVQARGETVTVNVTTSAAPKYTSELMDGPFRLVLDFEDARYRWTTAPVPGGADPVKEIRGSQYRKGVARLVIELTRRAPFTLEPHAGGVRVVFAAPAARAPAAPRPPAYRLEGTVVRDEGTSVAYIAEAATNKVGAYRVGDPLGDGVVETIDERHVVLRTPRGTVELRMAEPRPAR